MNGTLLLLIGIAIFVTGIFGMFLLLISSSKRSRKQPLEHRDAIINDNTAPQKDIIFPISPPLSSRLPYERRPYLLTQAELTFFDILRAATPNELAVFPQIRLASIVNVAASARREYKHFNRIQAKCVDFVLCDAKTTAPQLVVELDDSSHNRPDRQERDRFVDEVLNNAGIPILHVRWQRHYNAEEIGASIRQLIHIGQVTPVTDWSRPIANTLPIHTPTTSSPIIASSAATLNHSVEQFSFKMHYSCGQCHQEIKQGTKFCPHCGVML